MKKCSFCAEEIQDAAIKCKHCGMMLNIQTSLQGYKNKNSRKCLQCGYVGKMKTWLGNYFFPQFIVLIGFLFAFIPGLIFIVWGWGKYVCPACGALAKNKVIS